MTVTIREAMENDLSCLLPLYVQLGLDNGTVLRLDGALSILRRLKTYPDYRLYGAFSENHPVGVFALLIMDNLGHTGQPSAVLEDIIVDERFRGKGIGKQMIDYALRMALAKNCYKLSLSSNRQRTGAHRFYENLGFEKHGVSFAVYFNKEKTIE